jgi:hypothetical protein
VRGTRTMSVWSAGKEDGSERFSWSQASVVCWAARSVNVLQSTEYGVVLFYPFWHMVRESTQDQVVVEHVV